MPNLGYRLGSEDLEGRCNGRPAAKKGNVIPGLQHKAANGNHQCLSSPYGEEAYSGRKLEIHEALAIGLGSGADRDALNGSATSFEIFLKAAERDDQRFIIQRRQLVPQLSNQLLFYPDPRGERQCSIDWSGFRGCRVARCIEMVTKRLVGVPQAGFGILNVQEQLSDLYPERHALGDDHQRLADAVEAYGKCAMCGTQKRHRVTMCNVG
jgi:hypothetical protein